MLSFGGLDEPWDASQIIGGYELISYFISIHAR